MKHLKFWNLIPVILFASNSYAQYSPAIEQINKFITQGKCSDAEIYARSYIQRPIMLTALGIISVDCKRNKQEAINYFNLAAAENESVAIELLNSMGISYNIPKTSITFSSDTLKIIQAPPPHTLSPAPSPRGNNIILVQPQLAAPMMIQPSFNASACIQDGGDTYCPNHPNTQIRPIYPFGK